MDSWRSLVPSALTSLWRVMQLATWNVLFRRWQPGSCQAWGPFLSSLLWRFLSKPGGPLAHQGKYAKHNDYFCFFLAHGKIGQNMTPNGTWRLVFLLIRMLSTFGHDGFSLWKVSFCGLFWIPDVHISGLALSPWPSFESLVTRCNPWSAALTHGLALTHTLNTGILLGRCTKTEKWVTSNQH